MFALRPRRRSSSKYAVKRGHRLEGAADPLAEDHRRHALAQHALPIRIVEQRGIGMVVDVDEARRDGEPGRVDGARRGSGRAPEDHDAAIPDAEIGIERRIARPVDNAAAADDQIELRALAVNGHERSGDDERRSQ